MARERRTALSLRRRRLGRRRSSAFMGNLRKNWGLFAKSRIGLAGLGILVFFTFIAFSASVLTPYNPLRDYNLAALYAKPAWLGTGDPGYSLDFRPVPDGGFSGGPSSINQWQVGIPTSVAANVSIVYVSENGNPEAPAPGITGSSGGHIAIVISRNNASAPLGHFYVTFNMTIYYPYARPPRFLPTIAWLTDFINGSMVYTVNASITKLDGEDYYNSLADIHFREISLYGSRLYNTETIGFGGEISWTTPAILESYPMDSTAVAFRQYVARQVGDVNAIGFPNPLHNVGLTVFPEAGNYRYSYLIGVNDSVIGSPLQAEIHLDDMTLVMLGANWGVLGTDQYGRDLFSQLLYGAAISLMIGLTAAGVAVALGVVVGLVSGYYGGSVDEVLMRFSDVLLVIPGLPLLIVLMAVLGPNIWNVVIVVGFLGWMGIARLIRSQVLSLKERPFIESARAAGASDTYIIFKHIFPNVIPLVYAQLALAVPGAILTEAALSFLGLGDPSLPTWGQMFYNAWYTQSFLNWWWTIPPGLCIALMSISFVFIGYALDEIFNPRLRRR